MRIFLTSIFTFIIFFKSTLADDIVLAEIDTNKGLIVCELFWEQVPMTVSHFILLAEGKLDNQKRGEPFYDGLRIYQVVPNLMLLTGCPQNTGTGHLNYTFPDEIVHDIKPNKRGYLVMDTQGYDRNGCRFFITLSSMDFLSGKKTVFGKVIRGDKLLETLKKGDLIKKITIRRLGPKAQNFALKEEDFQNYKKQFYANKHRFEINLENMLYKYAQEKYPNHIRTNSGSRFIVSKKSREMQRPKMGDKVWVRYTGKLLDGTIFDKNIQGVPYEFTLGQQKVIPVWEEMVPWMKIGETRIVVTPPKMAFGRMGKGEFVPPNTPVEYEITLVKFEDKNTPKPPQIKK